MTVDLGAYGFNPLTKEHLADTFVRKLGEQPKVALASDISSGRIGRHIVNGAGIYALYLHGACVIEGRRPYRRISGKDWPIYIGKASASGGRTGAAVDVGMGSGSQLYKRIREHRNSLQQANANLTLALFRVRWLAVDPAFIGTAEVFLIERFQPIWNVMSGGFGSNAVGKNRVRGEIASWDALHPGRGGRSGGGSRAARRARSLAAIEQIEQHLARPWPFGDPYARPLPSAD
jgi:hypothetical protein